MRRSAASSIEEELSISHVEMLNARLAAACSVYTFGLDPLVTHQPIDEGENGDFSFRLRTSKLSLKRSVETQVVGWGGADVAD